MRQEWFVKVEVQVNDDLPFNEQHPVTGEDVAVVLHDAIQDLYENDPLPAEDLRFVVTDVSAAVDR